MIVVRGCTCRRGLRDRIDILEHRNLICFIPICLVRGISDYGLFVFQRTA